MEQGKTSHSFTFDRRIDALRAATGWRWADIATKLGVTREHLYNYRKGKHQPKLETIRCLEQLEQAAGIAADGEARRPAGGSQPHSMTELLAAVRDMSERLEEVRNSMGELRDEVARVSEQVARMEERCG